MRHMVKRRAVWAATVAGLVLATLVACGGGSVGTNGTGGPVLLGLSVGTVSGLGSVIVDGTRHDDSAASVEIRREGAQAEVGDARLGHRVSLEFGADTAGAQVLQRLELLPSVVGRVSERTADTLGVLGQTVLANSDPARGPVTVFEAPWTSLADVQLGDAIEVHAIAQRTGSGVRDVRLVATRIAPRSTLGGVRVSGTVAELSTPSAGTHRFALGALTVELPSSGTLLPQGVALENGRTVTVFATEAAYDDTTRTLGASTVQSMAVGDPATAGTLQRAGLVCAWTGSAFELDGIALQVRADTQVLPAGRVVVDGAYVQVTASLDSSRRWQATRIEHLTSTGGMGTPASTAELRGTLDDWTPSTRSFTLRDTAVTLTANAQIDLGDCRGTTLADGQYVEVKGTTTAQGLSASEVKCASEPVGTKSRLERRGVVLSADTAARTLTLRYPSSGVVLTVAWTEQTYQGESLRAIGLPALVGTTREIEAEGTLSADGLRMVARKLTLRRASDS
jgi:Domain of unknown function (DUF5666)